MKTRIGAVAQRIWGNALTAVVVVVIAAAVGVTSVEHSSAALVVGGGVLLIGILVTNPVFVIACTVGATLLMARVGGALSVADVVLALSTVLAIVLFRGRGIRTMAPVLWAGVTYLAVIIPTTILNPYEANITEWAHDLVLVLGSLIVGFAIGRSGKSQLAIGLYVLACVGIGVAAIIVGLVMLAQQGKFGPVYLPQLDKNLIGCALAAAIIILYGRPAWFRLGATWRWLAILICGVAVAASGARQAMVGLAVGLLVVALRRHPETGKFPKLPWISAFVIIFVVWGLVSDQLSSNNQFSSANQRLDWYGQSIEIWQKSPVFGVGLRWWYTSRFDANFQPPNLELEQLTTVGVVGLLALLALFAVAVVALWRLDPWYGTVGVAVVIARFTESQFDLYWIAGQASFLWIITGICYGALERDRRRAEPSDERALSKRVGARWAWDAVAR